MGINLEKHIQEVKISLKKMQFNEKLRVVLALDISGSMQPMFQSGLVDRLVERLLAIGINMDDNGEIEVFAYDHSAREIGVVTRDNIDGYVKKHIAQYVGGGTNYAPVMQQIAEKIAPKKTGLRALFSKHTTNIKEAAVVFFVTDGTNSDQSATRKLLIELAGRPIFWQYVGISNRRKTTFPFLEELDHIEGRVVDNANFFNAGDIDNIHDQELYDRILGELPQWYAAVKHKKMVE